MPRMLVMVMALVKVVRMIRVMAKRSHKILEDVTVVAPHSKSHRHGQGHGHGQREVSIIADAQEVAG